MPSTYSLDPDDDLPLAADEATHKLHCRRCGDPVTDWQFNCPSCGSSLDRQQLRSRAIPVAPPGEDVPLAEEVEVEDAFDVPVADVLTDQYGVPAEPYGRPRRRRRPPRPRKPTVG